MRYTIEEVAMNDAKRRAAPAKESLYQVTVRQVTGEWRLFKWARTVVVREETERKHHPDGGRDHPEAAVV